MYGTFLRAQEDSPSLVLAHSGIGDEGALEVAHFLAESRCLVHLDLSGCSIGAVGVKHLAKAMKVNQTLKSLVLQHNRIGEEGEAGLVTLCRALHGNRILRHLDLRYNNLSGALAGSCLGELLKANEHLTHLELSWNPLDPAGGQSLLDSLQMNTTLFDCQLTSCRLGKDTLVRIAELLLRNRKAKGADLQAGPYMALSANARCDSRNSGGRSSTVAACGSVAGAFDKGVLHGDDGAGAGKVVVTAGRSGELMDMLAAWRVSRREQGLPCDTAQVQEFIDFLDGAQRELDEVKEATEQQKEHTRLLLEGFQDRELRYRKDIAAAQDRLVDHEKEMVELRAVHRRHADELALEREADEQAQREMVEAHRRSEAEEMRLKSDLIVVGNEQRELTEHLGYLEEKRARMEEEHSLLRSKVDRVRAGVTLLHH